MTLASDPYLEPADVRERITAGSPPLDNSFTDEWVADTVTEVEELVEAECGVAFTPRETVETVQAPAPGGLHRLILKWPKVREIVSVTVDGDDLEESGWTLDADAGILTLASCAAAGVSVVVTYQHGFDAPPKALLRATAIYVERCAAGERSRSNRDVRYATDSGAVVYTRPNPGTWQITGWDDFDAIVARLPHLKIPGLA